MSPYDASVVKEQRRGDVFKKKPTRVIFNKAPVEVSQLVGGDVATGVIRRLEVQVVFARLVELRGSNVHTNNNLICVAGLGDGILQQFQSWEGEKRGVKVRSEILLIK